MVLEKKYIEKISLSHRKKFAQFFTPETIADLMSDWLIGNKKLKTVLEPAFGLGVFSRNLLKKKPNLNIKGFDIDETIFNEAQSFFAINSNVSLNLEDYMFNDWSNEYDGIICNPPYFKFHDYDNKSILKEIENRLNFKFNGFTNLYTLFLLKSIYQLAPNGRMAYIIPSEFLNSDYGKLVKEYLVKTNTLRHLFVIDFKENVFDDALTTASILLLAKDNNDREINISTIKSKSDLKKLENYINSYPKLKGEFVYKPTDLDPNIKWRKYYQVQKSDKYKNLVPFSKYAKVVRGIATGANDYFTFRPSKAKKYSIQSDNLLPCICRAKDVKSVFFTMDDFKQLEENDEPVFLFDALKSKNEAVEKYIRKGIEEGINEKYLTKSRKIWYSLENRPPAPIWVSVFNRNGLKFIRNEAGISNLTTFHCVYLKQSDLFSKINPDLLFAYLLTDIAKKIFSDNRREYGNGLKKFEPNDLNKAQMLNLSLLNDETTNQVLSLYKAYRKELKQVYIEQINEIFEKEYSQPESHTHLQFAKTIAQQPKIANDHVLSNAINRMKNNVRKRNNAYKALGES